jgi:hypothetical protein
MGHHKQYREDRVPVGPNRLNRLIEVVIAVALLFAVTFLLRY